MGTATERRKQKKAEKKRVEKKAEDKAKRTRAQQTAKSEGSRGAAWSVGPAWVSQGWHEQGAQVHAVFSRRRPDGHSSAALFEIDLAEKGVVAVKVISNASDDRLLGEVGRRSTEERAMQETSPDLVARLVREASAWGEQHGHAQPGHLKEAVDLMGDVDGSNWTDPIKLGRADAPPPPSAGLGARIKRWLWGDPITSR
jgi:hypothetical protein